MKIRIVFASGLATALLLANQSFAQEPESWTQAMAHPQAVTAVLLNGQDPGNLPSLPPELLKMTNLQSLNISCMEKLERLPAEISQLSKLESISIDEGNGCSSNVAIPASISELKSLKSLTLYGAIDGSAVPGKASRPLPASLAQMPSLKELNIGRNALKQIPEWIGTIGSLQSLNLSFNQLKSLPPALGNLKNLQSLDVHGSGLKTLPAGLAQNANLKIEMGDNSLSKAEQAQLKAKFPKAVFSFQNEFDGEGSNQ